MLSSSITPSKRPSQAVRIAVVEKVLKAYGLPYRRILAVQQGYRNHSFPIELANGELANLILYKREPDILSLIRSANQVSGYAALQGLPCRQLRGPIAVLGTAHHVKYAALYNYLPGQTIPWESYTKDHIKALGMTMSDLHAALRSLPKGNLPNAADVYGEITRRMDRYFSEPGVCVALASKLNLTISKNIFAANYQVLAICKRLADQQPLHLDFVRGNILFQNRPDKLNRLSVTISGILDFEKTAFGHPLWDIARTLAFLLVDCKYKSEPKIRKYFLASGYGKRGSAPLPKTRLRLGGKQIDLLELLINLFLLHDFYKFLRHNPYEYLPQNEHFRRTRTLLVERELINS